MRYQIFRNDGELRVRGVDSVVTKVMHCAELLEAGGEAMKAVDKRFVAQDTNGGNCLPGPDVRGLLEVL